MLDRFYGRRSRWTYRDLRNAMGSDRFVNRFGNTPVTGYFTYNELRNVDINLDSLDLVVVGADPIYEIPFDD
jgi:hypothetical protein